MRTIIVGCGRAGAGLAEMLAGDGHEVIILDQATDRVIRQCGADRGVHSKTTLQTARDVVFTAAFPNTEAPRGRHTSFTRIEPQHYFTKANDVPATVSFRLRVQNTHQCQSLAGSSFGDKRWKRSKATR